MNTKNIEKVIDAHVCEAEIKAFLRNLVGSDCFFEYLDHNEYIFKSEADLERYLAIIEKKRNILFRNNRSKAEDIALIIMKVNFVNFSYFSDIRMLNITLKVCDFIINNKMNRKVPFGTIRDLTKNLVFSSAPIEPSYSKVNDSYISNSELLINDPVKCLDDIETFSDKSVVVFCPNYKSKYTLSVLALLQKKNVTVKAIVVKKILSPSRFIKEYKRDGRRLINKIIRKLILGDNKKNDVIGRNLHSTCVELGINHTSIYSWAKETNVPVITCSDMNESHVSSNLNQLGYDYGIFTGGGILGQSLLETANIGILNCHAGILPKYRGMDVIEWPVLLGNQTDTGMTVHFMVPGIDEGDIVCTFKLDKRLDVKSARYELESWAPYLQVLSLLKLLNGYEASKQVIEHGMNFYVMHESVFELACQMSSKIEN